MRGLLASALMLAAVAARAETIPRNVNDCTLLRDPSALRACVDSFKTPEAERARRDAELDALTARRRTPSGETPRGSGPPR